MIMANGSGDPRHMPVIRYGSPPCRRVDQGCRDARRSWSNGVRVDDGCLVGPRSGGPLVAKAANVPGSILR